MRLELSSRGLAFVLFLGLALLAGSLPGPW